MEKNNFYIDQSQQILSPKTGQNTYNFTVNEQLDVHLIVPENSTGLLMFNILGFGTFNFTLEFKANSNLSFLYLNESNHQLEISEKVILHEQVQLNANYGELSDGNHKRTTVFELVGRKSHLEVRSASIAFGKLDWKMSAVHKAKETYAMLKNYGIVLESGFLGFEVLGNIEKHNSQSKTHQETRVMNMAKDVKAIVYPQLIIDENDVEASHAASVGQPDPIAVYYMKSRGLTEQEVLNHMILGYLLPIIDIIEDETIKEQLSERIVSKVMA